MSSSDLQQQVPSLACFAVKVRTRAEEHVANLLRQKEFRVLLPTFTDFRRYSDRVCRITSALFPGYVFVWMGSRDVMRLLTTDGVSYVVRNGDAVGSLSCREIRAIEALCNSSDSREPCVSPRIGQRVIVESGPFAGVEGVLVNMRSINRVVITVQALCSSVSVEIATHRLRFLGDNDFLRSVPPGTPIVSARYPLSS